MIQKLCTVLSVCLIGNLLFAQAPSISNFTPSSGPIGTTVTISGSNFNNTLANNVVYFGPVKATVTSATTSSLSVVVPKGANYQPIRVLNTATGLRAQSNLPFRATFSAGLSINSMSFAAKIDSSTAVRPTGLAVGDMDGDGKTDLVFAHSTGQAVAVRLNKSSNNSMAFDPRVNLPLGGSATGLAVDDLDGDGKLDIAAANASGLVSLFRNTSTTTGMLSFAPRIDSAVGSSAQGVAIGDLNLDGKPDLAVVNSSASTVSVLINTSTPGSLSFANRVFFSVGSQPFTLAIGDIDGDARPDIVSGNAQSGTISVLRNTSTAGVLSMANKVDFDSGGFPFGTTLADIDGDGKLDVLVVDQSIKLTILRNTSTSGSVTFATKLSVNTESAPIRIAVGDIDGDGKVEVAVSNNSSNSVSVFKNNSVSGIISFGDRVDLDTGDTPFANVIADLNEDDKPDLAVANQISNTVSLYRNNLSLPPSILSYSPMSGGPGDTITITGNNLTGIVKITFGDSSATSFQVLNPTQIKAVVGNGASGDLAVLIEGDTLTLPGFVFNDCPVTLVVIDAMPGDTICPGDTVTFEANAIVADSTATFEWYLNGDLVGTDTILTIDTLANLDTIICIVRDTCGMPITARDTVIIHHKTLPTLTSALTPPAVCSGTPFAYTPTSDVPGTTFQWRRKAVSGISNPASMGMGAINETLNDTLTTPVLVTYEIFNLSANGCTRPDTFKVVLQVKPIPKLTSSTVATSVCSGTLFSYTPTSSVMGTTITWNRAFVNGVTNASGTGTTPIAESLNNGGTTSVNVTYTFTLLANACTNPVSPSLIVSVKPVPQVNSSNTALAVCSGTAFNYVPGSNLAGATFNWTRAAVNGISNSARTDTGRINEILFNTTTSPVNVNYQYTAVLNGCTSTIPFTLSVPVNPSPLLTSTLTPAAICSGTSFEYTPTSNNNNVNFTWTRVAVAGISNPAASGTGNIGEILTNTTTDTVAVVYSYILSASGCSDPNPKNVTVLVKPMPRLSSSLTPPAICSGATFSYLPTSETEGTAFNWSRAAAQGITNPIAVGSGNPNENLINLGNGPATVIYVYTMNAAGCIAPQTANVSVIVNQAPGFSSTLAPPNLCSGAVFRYTPTSLVQGATFNWTRGAIAGISGGSASGTGNPNETLINTSPLPIDVTYIYTVSANGCTNPQTYSVVVKVLPYPSISSEANPPAICSGTAFDYTPLSNSLDASFTWTRAAVNGISNPAASGTDNPNEVLINSTDLPQSVLYAFRVSSNGCSNPNPLNVLVVVKPRPKLTSGRTLPTICSGEIVSYQPNPNIGGATMLWTRPQIPGISTPERSGQNIFQETLTTTSPNPVKVIYLYTLSADGCTSTVPDTVSGIINPLPTLSSPTLAPAICSGTLFSYLPKSETQGTTFAWFRFPVNGIAEEAAAGTGNPAEVLTNTTEETVSATYQYTLNTISCSNPLIYYVAVHVNPTPTLTSTLTPEAICSGSPFNYTPASSIANTTFSWSRAMINGISNAAASGTGNPGEALINTTANPIEVSYLYTLQTSGCNNDQTYRVKVVVNPRPALSSTLSPSAICSGSTFNYTPTSATSGTTFSWSRQSINGISNQAATGSGNPNEILINTTAAPVNVTYTYTLTANACATSINNSVVVRVNPLPTLSSDLALEASCSGTSFTYTPTSATGEASFSWTRAAVNGISNATASGVGTLTETLNNSTNAPLSVAYVFTLSANGCTNPSTFTVNKSINPLPNLTSSLNPAAICSGTSFAYTPNSNVEGTTFAWTRAAVTGINNGAASGNGNINEVLLNNTSSSLNVVYQYTLIANGCNNPNSAQITLTVNAKPTLITNNPAPRCTTLINLQDAAITAGSSAGLTLSYWRDAATTVPLIAPQNTEAGVYYIKGTFAGSGCFEVKPVTVIIGRIPDVAASGKTICSGIPAGITVLNPNAAPGATFNWTASYGNARIGQGSGTGAPFGVNAINELLINLTRKVTDVVYTITPVGSQDAGCVGQPISITVKVNSMSKACPEAEPTAFRETIPHNTAPQTKVNMVKPKKRKKYLVQAISNPDSVEGVSEAPYTRPRGSVFEENALKNNTRQPATVVYTIAPYTNGRNWRDNNGTKDDVLGASFDIAVTVQPGPGFQGPDEPEIAAVPQKQEQKQGDLNKSTSPLMVVAPALLDYMAEVAHQTDAEKVVLLQNVPNPFQGYTQIGFYLPETASAKLSIRDAKGAILYQVQGNYTQGWNLLELNSTDFRVSGVLYYSLETAKFVETKRMVVLK